MTPYNNIILVGFSGTGKSTIGAEVARMLNWSFFDVDTEVATSAGKPIPSIFSVDGEACFRQLELTAVRRACGGNNTVIATGGGVLTSPESRKLIFDSGLVVALDARPETILKRLINQEATGPAEERPLLTAPDPLQRIHDLKAERQPHYALANWTIHTDGLTHEQVAMEVRHALQLLKHNLTHSRNDRDTVATVNHSTGSYPIKADWDILDRLGETVAALYPKGPAYIISDNTVFPQYGRQAQRSLHKAGIEAHSFIIPSGELSKTPAMAQAIYDWLASRRAERRHIIIAVGGGVVGDLAGFVAATYLRGMPFVQVPTSMAAMVDACIGGKVAVNLPQAKNLVGAFHQPILVLADPKTLTTLDKRLLSEGWAEAIKHGLILDPNLVALFEENAPQLMALDPEISTHVIKESMSIKAQIVSEDERETGGRRTLLNYGHTIGHALEASTAYGKYLHGEAVSIGMMGAIHISQALNMVSMDAVKRQGKLLAQFNLPLTASKVDISTVLEAMSLDKKKEEGSIRWVLLERIGESTTRTDVTKELVEQVVHQVISG